MAISNKKLFAIGGVLFISVILAVSLLYSSIVPQYSVGEFYNKQDKSSLVNKKIQLVGDVSFWQTSNQTFAIEDWQNYNYTVSVFYKNVQIPNGFVIGKRVVVEGILKQQSNNISHYYIQADSISTKCPSKYQS